MNSCLSMTAAFWKALGGPSSRLDQVTFAGAGALPSAFAVTDLASASIAAAGLAIAELKDAAGSPNHPVGVDRRLASMWFRSSIRPIDWPMPSLWDAIAGDYATKDGWIRLHTNAPHHRLSAQKVLGDHADRDAMQRAVSQWDGLALESAVVDAGGCAAQMHEMEFWRRHPQGLAVALEPLVEFRPSSVLAKPDLKLAWTGSGARPLRGLRVLDLTRVLAGPTATRFLAGYGADVLRIDPMDWNEPAVVPEVTLGKRCARLDLRSREGRERFEELLAGAHVLVHGLRNGALDGLGYDVPTRRAIAPGLVDVSLNAYGFTGPWAHRRGFDSLLQMSSGIACHGMRWRNERKPVPLPAQALDHATGYLMAATVVRGLTERLKSGRGLTARTSLARMAKFLIDTGTLPDDQLAHPVTEPAAETASDRASGIERTSWGAANRLRPPLEVEGVPMTWELAATDLGSADPVWQPT